MTTREHLGFIRVSALGDRTKWKIEDIDLNDSVAMIEHIDVNSNFVVKVDEVNASDLLVHNGVCLFFGSRVGVVSEPSTMARMRCLLSHVVQVQMEGAGFEAASDKKRGRGKWLSIDAESLKAEPCAYWASNPLSSTQLIEHIDEGAVLMHMALSPQSAELLIRELNAVQPSEHATLRRFLHPAELMSWPYPQTPAVPFETDASAHRRAKLLARDWYSSTEVGQMLGSEAGSNPNQYAARLRKAGKLLGVWVVSEKAYRHPPCQFFGGRLLPQIEPLLELLPGPSGSGWEQAEWLYSPHALLDGSAPAQMLLIDPDRVLSAATREYREDKDAGW